MLKSLRHSLAPNSQTEFCGLSVTENGQKIMPVIIFLENYRNTLGTMSRTTRRNFSLHIDVEYLAQKRNLFHRFIVFQIHIETDMRITGYLPQL